MDLLTGDEREKKKENLQSCKINENCKIGTLMTPPYHQNKPTKTPLKHVNFAVWTEEISAMQHGNISNRYEY